MIRSTGRKATPWHNTNATMLVSDANDQQQIQSGFKVPRLEQGPLSCTATFLCKTHHFLVVVGWLSTVLTSFFVVCRWGLCFLPDRGSDTTVPFTLYLQTAVLLVLGPVTNSVIMDPEKSPAVINQNHSEEGNAMKKNTPPSSAALYIYI